MIIAPHQLEVAVQICKLLVAIKDHDHDHKIVGAQISVQMPSQDTSHIM
jgi:hypothetical protein